MWQYRPIKVGTFKDLPKPTSTRGWEYEVLVDSGIKFLPAWLTRNPYKCSGIYVSDGKEWVLKQQTFHK
jgi:hypothetical protein